MSHKLPKNVWISKGESDVEQQGMYKDGFEDILETVRQSSDFKYALHGRDEVEYKYRIKRSTKEINSHVSKETGLSISELEIEARSILEEMAHSLNMKVVRSFAYFMVKVFKALYGRVYVNHDGIQKLRELLVEYPVILMPTHRSYLDFLLVSYVHFDCDLPLPVIAAAMDFKGMKFFGWMLRNCGAFYIRRSFGTDKLYWALFTEYVQTHLRNGDAPLEFFVEGTRSRSGKSYVPRIGMLSATLESYFKAEVPDIMIVPVSISYERIIEESIYAYEMLGIPKPKESTSGVFKARSVLWEDYGNVHYNVCDAISVRQWSTGRIDRTFHSREPRYINSLTAEEQALARDLAYVIVRSQQRRLVTSPWSLVCTVLMLHRTGINERQLYKDVDWLKRHAVNLGAHVDWPGNASVDTVIAATLRRHSNVVSLVDDEVQMKTVTPAAHAKAVVTDSLMLNAATALVLASYRNQVLHVLVRPAMLAVAVNGVTEDRLSRESLYKKYEFLEQLLKKDFIFQPGERNSDFENALRSLTNSRALAWDGEAVDVQKSINKYTSFLTRVFEPFLLCYWIVCQYLLSLRGHSEMRPLAKKPKELCRDCQRVIIRLIQEGVVQHLDMLSLDTISNGLTSLVDMGAMYRDKRNDEAYISPNRNQVHEIASTIEKFIETPQSNISNLILHGKTVIAPSKL